MKITNRPPGADEITANQRTDTPIETADKMGVPIADLERGYSKIETDVPPLTADPNRYEVGDDEPGTFKRLPQNANYERFYYDHEECVYRDRYEGGFLPRTGLPEKDDR